MLVFAKNKDLIKDLKKALSKDLELSELGDVKYYLGIDISRDRKNKTITLSQKGYLDKILERFNKNGLNPVSTPIEVGIRLEKSTEIASKERTRQFQAEVGSLLYLSTKTRPDLAYAVGQVSKFMSNPNESHFRALNRIWKYLNDPISKDLKLVLNAQSKPLLKGYSNAD